MPDLIGHLVVITLLLSSCTKAPSLVGFSSSFAGLTSESPIEFALADGATKSLTPITSLPALAKRDFSVSARYTPEGETFDVPGGTSIKYFENHRFGYITNNPDGDSYTDSWRGVATHAATTGAATADPVYWPLDGSLTFFCYAPYHADATLATPPVPDTRDIVLESAPADMATRHPDWLVGSPLIRYTPAATASKQEDLLVANPLLDRHRSDDGGHFPLDFSQHQLTWVEFQFNYDGILDNALESVRVNSIAVQGVVSSKYLYFTESTPYVTGCAWSDAVSPVDKDDPTAALPTAGYRISAESGELLTGDANRLLKAPEPHRALVTDKGRLYLLPQTLTDSAALEITYAIYDQHGVTLKVSDIVVLKLKTAALTAWAPGTHVRYLITLNIPPHQGAGFTVQVYPWDNAGNTNTPQEMLPHD